MNVAQWIYCNHTNEMCTLKMYKGILGYASYRANGEKVTQKFSRLFALTVSYKDCSIYCSTVDRLVWSEMLWKWWQIIPANGNSLHETSDTAIKRTVQSLHGNRPSPKINIHLAISVIPPSHCISVQTGSFVMTERLSGCVYFMRRSGFEFGQQ